MFRGRSGRDVEGGMSSAHFEAVLQDLRYTCRFLIGARTFTATVLATLALGIGATAAVFTIVDVLLLRRLPVEAPEQLFALVSPGRDVDLSPAYYSHGFYEHLRDAQPRFATLIASSIAVTSGVNLD